MSFILLHKFLHFKIFLRCPSFEFVKDLIKNTSQISSIRGFALFIISVCLKCLNVVHKRKFFGNNVLFISKTFIIHFIFYIVNLLKHQI